MNRNLLLEKYGRTPEDRFLLARLCDRAVQSEKTGRVTCSDFLDPARRVLVTDAFRGEGIHFTFHGGYEGAERTVCLFAPGYEDFSYGDALPLCALRAELSGGPVTHRDFLGALMALGVKRETVGDILVYPGGGDIVVLDDIAQYLCYNLQSVGRYACEVTEVPLSALVLPEKLVKTVRATVASLRLDAVLAAAFSLSRGEAAETVRAGKVSVDHRLCESSAAEIRPGALLSLRGGGRVRLVSAGAPTRRGRIPIELEKTL